MSVVLPVTILLSPQLVSTPERLESLLVKIQDFSPVLESVGGLIEEALAENFTTQGYGQWAGLADSTVRERFRLGYGPNQPLVRSAKLMEALTEHDGEGHKFLVQPDQVCVGVFGDAVAYAASLNEGDPAHHLPARVLVQLTPGTVERILQMILDWLGGPDGVRVTAGPVMDV